MIISTAPRVLIGVHLEELLMIPAAVGGVLAAIGVILLASLGSSSLLRARLRSSPRIPIGHGASPGTVTLEGFVRALEACPTAPISGCPSVYARSSAYDVGGRRNRHRLVAQTQHAVWWMLEDQQGRSAIVDPTALRIVGAKTVELGCSTFTEPPPHVEAWAKDQGRSLRAPIGTPWPHRFEEELLAPGTWVSVNGVTSVAPDGRIVIGAPPLSCTFVVVGRGEDVLARAQARRRQGRALVCVGVIAGLGFAIASEWALRVKRERRAAEAAERFAIMQAKVRSFAEIERDAATRAAVLRSDVQPDPTRRRLAIEFPATLRPKLWNLGPEMSSCVELSAKPPGVVTHSVDICSALDLIAIVRSRGPDSRTRFVGDALVYDLRDGSYLGGVVLDVSPEQGETTIERSLAPAVRLAITGDSRVIER
ncbi:MAG TPA: GIDE domain-containing protein [Nannocystaceae bacterium]|nr:GIDE domain-containing protein [Nannocystaceae bacterium]